VHLRVGDLDDDRSEIWTMTGMVPGRNATPPMPVWLAGTLAGDGPVMPSPVAAWYSASMPASGQS
jgi:hypothetical protein